MPDNAPRLLKMAEAEFPDLTEPEREVVRCAAVGEWADLAQWGPQPAKGKKRKPGGGPLRSSVLTWLCTDVRAKRLVHRKGLFILHASLDTQLDLQSADVPFFFGLHACRLPGLDAKGARIGSNLYLKHCYIDGMLDIHSTCIGGQVLCDGALVRGVDGVSIRADGADIDGPVFFSKGFCALGGIRLLGAKIKGPLDCTGGHFLNHKGYALTADRAEIGSDVLLCGRASADGVSYRFRAVGEVRLLGAVIKGQLNCDGGTFLNKNGVALHLQGASVSDAILLEPKRLRGVVNLYCAVVEGVVRMRSESTAKTIMDLRGAKVNILIDSQKSWPETGKLTLDGFVYEEIHHKSPRSVADRLEWLRRMPNGQFLPQPYEQLAKWFQKTGHDSEAREIRIAKEEARLTQWYSCCCREWKQQVITRTARWVIQNDSTFHLMPCRLVNLILEYAEHKVDKTKPTHLLYKEPAKRIWWKIKRWTIGYGYKPHYALGWLFIFWLIGTGFFWYGYPQGITKSASHKYSTTQQRCEDLDNCTEPLGKVLTTNYPLFHPFIYSLDVALPIVDLQQERFWMPDSESKAEKNGILKSGVFLWWVNWLEVLLGWFLASMGIAGATGIIRKD